MADPVLLERDGDIAVVTLNRPDKLNALSPALMTALIATFAELKADSNLAAVILTGAGRAFCAGLDLGELSKGGLSTYDLDGAHDIQSAILGFDRPIIGAINGAAATGGFEMAMWCDVMIASEQARFTDTHAKGVGLIPGWGLSQRLSRTIGIYRARELSFTGNILSAQQACEWGLVNRVVPSSELLPTCKALAKDMASCDRATLMHYKRLINEGAEMDMGAALKYERFAMDLHSYGRSPNFIAEWRDSVSKKDNA